MNYNDKILNFSIFSVKLANFETDRSSDPFGFDDFSSKLAEKYLPFSGSVRKPSYFLFAAYLDYLFNKPEFINLSKNRKELKEKKIRLEKLLVYCWKSNGNTNLKSASIIGNRFEKEYINPLSGRNWVKQPAFEIYNKHKFIGKTLELYTLKNKEQEALLLSFLKMKDDLTNNNKLNKIIISLCKNKFSLFANHILSNKLQNTFRTDLKKAIESIPNPDKAYCKTIKDFIDKRKKFSEVNLFKSTLDNINFPFQALNNWFKCFINAVDADINNNAKRKSLWVKANNAYDGIKEKGKLNKRPNREIWFNIENSCDKYCFTEKFEKDTSPWEAYKRRQGEDGQNYFFYFRHYALYSLLKELS